MDATADGSAAAARFAAVVRATEGLLLAAKASGLVVILEDLHWADDATLPLLRYLASAELSTCPLLIVGTSRDPLPDGLAGLTDAWIQRLAPLTVAEVAQYLGPGVHQSWPVAVHRRSAGNALFVSELSRLLQPSDMTEPTDGAWKVPTDLVRLISARVNQLPDRCR
jgi:predicted ATPase